MKARNLVILDALNDIHHAMLEAFKKRDKTVGLILAYAFIDICAALSNDKGDIENSKVFTNYINEHDKRKRRFSAEDLWAARSATLHAFSRVGRNHRKGKAKAIFYYAYPDKKADAEKILAEEGYTDVHVVDVMEIEGIATWCYNSWIMRWDDDEQYAKVVTENGKHIILLSHQVKLRRFLEWVDSNGA